MALPFGMRAIPMTVTSLIIMLTQTLTALSSQITRRMKMESVGARRK
jgi:hypothetical protein